MKQFSLWLKLVLTCSAALAVIFACAQSPVARTQATADAYLPTIVQSTALIQKQPTPAPTQPIVASPTVAAPPSPTQAPVLPVAGYKVVNSYPHDPQAFTQGLVYQDGIFYEGTGLQGRSSLRKVAVETGVVSQSIQLDQQYFGEGIAVLGDKIYQLTWQNHVGFIYNKNTFEQIGQFQYATEGWGLTTDGTQLIMSDGSSNIYFLDPQTLQETRRIAVSREGGGPVTNINELEYINGEIYANLWQTDLIARIDPASGQVVGWINLAGLLSPEDRTQPVDVLNGIAYDPATDRLFVTGKLWPKVFEIDIVNP